MTITVLDGGMGDEISKHMSGDAGGLWSAQALLDDPELVVSVHKAFIEAGAQIITTNTYATIPSYLGKAGLEGRYVELTRLGGSLARRAVTESHQSVRVAGSIPPLSESYRADMVPAASEALPIYKSMVEALNDNVDMYFCETMSSANEAVNAATQAVEYGKGRPVYVAWTLNETPGSGLRSGESVDTAYRSLEALDVAGFMFNCAFPEAIEAALDELRPLTDKPLGCYPNRTDRVDPAWTLDNDVVIEVREDLNIDAFVAASLRCVGKGASLVGGCCEVGPSYIKALATATKALR
jgi:S-methylmethionine-dependent homocysteine/selenocysteine methylase